MEGSFLAIMRLKRSLLSRVTSLFGNNRNGITEGKNWNEQIPQRDLQKSKNSKTPLRISVRRSSKSRETLVLDTDIFLYLKHKCEFYEVTLKEFSVLCQEKVDGDITTLYLEDVGGGFQSSNAQHVKGFIEEWSETLQLELRKETVLLEGKGDIEQKNIKKTCEELCLQHNRVFVNNCRTHIDIIGSSSDTYLFKTELMKLIEQKFT